MLIRRLTREETASAAFRHLLWLAVEVDDTALDEIRETQLPQLTVIGASEHDEVIGFAAFRADGGRITLEYIATAERMRGTGLGSRLIEAVRLSHPRLPLVAQTDDDAIGFYRRLGFADTPAARDPRWPDRPRYDCTLPPAGPGGSTPSSPGSEQALL